ncbi:norsolorinic acid reductase [Xylariomycetidae sp. FL2044]|nr:norsolorinic acid reductase [Xylariomycetidae sp. FL2044]
MSNVLPQAPPPKSPLARYRVLSPSAAVRVSPICLGAMNFGEAWKQYMGACDQQTSDQILDFFYEQGGNFIDTANDYQLGESEIRLGEWMKSRGVRDQMVIATKFTTNFRLGKTDEIMINNQGNGAKSLHVSVNASLQKLQTDYIDILYVHWWDWTTSIPELMQSLNRLVIAGKVLYLGASDMPAWVVSKANEYARNHGLRPFCVYQGRWSAAKRDMERDIIPMTKAEGMGLAPWGVLGGGKFKTEEQRTKTGGRVAEASQTDINVSRALESVARRHGTIITSVAQAYVMHKAPYVFPITGIRTLEHLKGSIQALTLSLSEEDIQEIESAEEFDIGFPYDLYWGKKVPDHPQKMWLLGLGGTTDLVAEPKPVAPKRNGE